MSRPPRGYSMLAALLIVAVLAVIAAAAIQLGGTARQGSGGERDHQQALALAELGLERTRAYLAQLSAQDVDFDRALDPLMDTTCAVGASVTFPGGAAEDHLPPFAGAGVGPVAAGPAGRMYLRVPMGGGAYLVRIDDNEDDEAGAYLNSTGNNAGAGCVEGVALAAARQNPVRDRDRTVTITAIGVFPGTDPATARATRTLRVAVGPAKVAGIYAGGNVNMNGASKVCGQYGDIASTGNLVNGCLCHAGCNGGPAINQCGTLGPATCDASAAGTCAASMGGGTCQASASVPPPPRVAPFDATNAPPPCTAAPCTPFYYLRHNPAANTTVYQWNYGGVGCANPRQFARLCHPTDAAPAGCSACWTPVYTNALPPYEVLITDDLGRQALSPGLAVVGGVPIWTVAPGAVSSTAGCNTGAVAPYPNAGSGFGVGMEEVPGTTFTLQVQPPQGVWLVEGNMSTGGVTTADCATHDGRRNSLIVVGNMVDNTTQLTLRPAAPKGYALLVGRDLRMNTGNTIFSTCATGGAVMVREQFTATANDHMEAQLIVENAAVCSAAVAGDAISTTGNFTVHVSGYPLVDVGGGSSTLTWAESTY